MFCFHAWWSLSCWCGSLCGSVFLGVPAWTWAHLPFITVVGLALTWFARPGLLRPDPSGNSSSVLSFPKGLLVVFGLLYLLAIVTGGAVADGAGVLVGTGYLAGQH